MTAAVARTRGEPSLVTRSPTHLGELEQLLLLAVLRLGEDAYARSVCLELDRRIGRAVSKGALYATFDRLADKGLLDWETAAPTDERGGLPRRLFIVSETGIEALRATKQELMTLWQGLDAILGES